MVIFTETPHSLIVEITPLDSVRLYEADQRKLIAYLWRTRPEMVREMVCEECPEHVEIVQNDNYHLNKSERGK